MSHKCRLVGKQSSFVRGRNQLLAVYFYQPKKLNECLDDCMLCLPRTEQVPKLFFDCDLWQLNKSALLT